MDPDTVVAVAENILASEKLDLLGRPGLVFRPSEHIVFHRLQSLPDRTTACPLRARCRGSEIANRTYYSVGGGFVIGETANADAPPLPTHGERVPHRRDRRRLACPLHVAGSVGEHAHPRERANVARRVGGARAAAAYLVRHAELHCGVATRAREGILPGGLKVKRRARRCSASSRRGSRPRSPGRAGLGRPADLWRSTKERYGGLVTAPTNGAAGIIPAVMHYYARATPPTPTTTASSAFSPRRWGGRHSLQDERVHLRRKRWAVRAKSVWRAPWRPGGLLPAGAGWHARAGGEQRRSAWSTIWG